MFGVRVGDIMNLWVFGFQNVIELFIAPIILLAAVFVTDFDVAEFERFRMTCYGTLAAHGGGGISNGVLNGIQRFL